MKYLLALVLLMAPAIADAAPFRSFTFSGPRFQIQRQVFRQPVIRVQEFRGNCHQPDVLLLRVR